MDFYSVAVIGLNGLINPSFDLSKAKNTKKLMQKQYY